MNEPLLARTQPRSATRLGVGGRVALLATLVALAALLPRLWLLADFVTIDEAAHWVERSGRFLDGLAAGDLGATHQTGHPGVTLMWLASLGLLLERLAAAQGWANPTDALQHLAWLRLPVALCQSLLIPLAFLLLRRLLPPSTALLAALLWCLAPFMVAHGRLLHLDGLLATFVTLSVLLLLVALQQPHSRLLLLASGMLAGLGILTKAPALILLPYSAGLLLWNAWREQPGLAALQLATGRFAGWLATALLTVLLLYPALWVDPARVLHSYYEEIADNGGRPNGAGQFFMGQQVDDPGPLFYLVVAAFRATPLTLLGIGLLLSLTLAERLRGRLKPQNSVLLALMALVLAWFLVMTLGPKKFDRYVLPAWPALEILAAVGLARAATLLGTGLGRQGRAALPAGLVALILTAEGGTLAFYHPYALSYYNPLLGGGRVAQQILLIGWGEGMDQVGAYLRSRPDLSYGPVLTALEPTLAPFVPVPVKSITALDRGDQNYAVVYLESIQRQANAATYATIRRTVPLHTVTIHGIDYAQIYQLPRPFERKLEAQLGEGLHLWGVTVERQQGRLVVTPSWDVRSPLPADYTLFLHLIDAAGRQVAGVDTVPGGADAPPTSRWVPGQQIAVPLPLDLPANLTPGRYELTLGLYDAATGQRLPLVAGPVADQTRAGGDALLLATLSLP